MVSLKEHAVLARTEQFNDNKTEQVWELFKNEFRNASRQLDGELGWAAGVGSTLCGSVHM